MSLCGCPKPVIHYDSDFDARVCQNCGVVLTGEGYITDELEDRNLDFVHLRVHTHYSLLKSICKHKDLIAKAKEYGMTALAKTEFGNMCGAPTFVKDCQDAGIKPILGVEFDTKFGKISYPITYIALNRTGYKSLVKLNTIAWCDRKTVKGDPFVLAEDVFANKDGLIAIVDIGVNPSLTEFIIASTKNLTETFIEVNRDSNEIGNLAEALSKKYNVKIIVTGNVLYTEEEDKEAYKIARKIDKSEIFTGELDNWFKPGDRFSGLFGFMDEWVTNTQKIADIIEDYNIINKEFIVPTYKQSGKEYTDLDEVHQKLEMHSWTGLYNLGLATDQKYVDRLKYELEVIKDKKFSSYFLIIYDIIKYMISSGKLRPIGRGSSIGSLVCDSLGITSMDPIKWGVPFERFINYGRIDLPDIDTDITQEGRNDVLRYIADVHGHDRVAQIATFQTLKVRAAVDNVGRVMQVPHTINRDIRKEISDEITDIDDLDDDIKEQLNYQDGWFDAAKSLTGVIKNLGYHAAGVVIANEPLKEMVPLLPEEHGLYGIQYDMRDCEILGLLKLDMLGLKTLDIVQHTLERIKNRYNMNIDIYNLPDDQATYSTISSGKYVSVFQLDSTGYRSLCRRLMPEKFEHIMALNALFRPGPLEGGMTEDYVERRHGKKEVVGWHPWLDEDLDYTFQVPIFQEQVMAISKKIAGFDDVQADKYRKAIGKKCITKDTEILTSTGVRISIEELLHNKHLLDELYFKIHDGKLGGEWADDKIRLRSSGRRKIYTIWTNSGRRIRCTSNHLIPTIKSMKLAFELKVGDYILRETVSEDKLYIDDKPSGKDVNTGLLLGLLVGDSRCTTSTIGFIQRDGEIADLFCDLIDKLEFTTYVKDTISNPSGVPTYRIITTHPSQNFVKRLVNSEGLAKTAKHKRCPISIKYSNDSCYIQSFLCGLLLSDGYVYVNHKNKCGYIGYSSHSYNLMSDVQYMLGRFGILSSIRRKQYIVNRKDKIYNGITYECAIRDRESVLKAYSLYKHLLVGYKLKSLAIIVKYLKDKNSNSQINKWPGFIGEYIESHDGFTSFTKLGLRSGQIKNGITHKKLSRLYGLWNDLDNIINGCIIPDRIVDIEISNQLEDTYDIETTRNDKECFVANGLLVHNSKEKFDKAQEEFKKYALKRDGLVTPAGWEGSLDEWIDDLLKRLAGYARYGWNCLHRDTLIDTCSRGSVPIKDVQVGEEVWSIREDSGDVFKNKVVKVINNGVRDTIRITTGDGNSIICTSNHRFLTPEHTYKYASDLMVGDKLKIFDKRTSRTNLSIGMTAPTHQNKIPIGIRSNNFIGNNVSEIVKIERYGDAEVWDLTMEQNPNFSANGIFVHNSGHACGYGWITYITAYLETHFPHEYYASLLDGTTNPKKLAILIRNILSKKVDIVPPDVNESGIEYVVGSDNKIYMGLGAIKAVGKAANAIIEDRNTNGSFKSFVEFCQRLPSVNKIVRVNLVKAGAFSWDKSICDRDKVDHADVIQKWVRKKNKKFVGTNVPSIVILSKLEEINGVDYTELERQQNERDVLNSYITGHPAVVYEKLSPYLEHGISNIVTPSNVYDYDIGQTVMVIGMLDFCKKKYTREQRNGNMLIRASKPYLNIGLSDQFNNVIINIWHPLCDYFEPMMVIGQVIMLECTIIKDKFRDGQKMLRVKNGIPLSNGIPIQGVFRNIEYDPSDVIADIGGMVNDKFDVGSRKYASIRGRINVLPNILFDVVSNVGDDVKFLISMDLNGNE